ncbi:hypothetical protein BDV95DRAFT_53107 [Massariosphaeria phaeospora]|uniref:Secreted protein n=1 Tax=Massariosphaeria phaeospora TaxID=100035 RepID=A0A7C8MJT7_9PLEO|nr:hypothetical protein BDV95DRAFT_53107 [Massariosphaeria phaeospora]
MLPLLTTGLLALWAAIAAARPQAAPIRPPTGVPKVITVEPEADSEGSGCRPGTIGVAFARDNSAMTIIFDGFKAGVGPKAGSLKKRAFCRVTVTMNIPGYAFDVSSVDFQGFISIEKGVDASLVSRWKWIDSTGADMKGKGNTQMKLTGPFRDDFVLHKDDEVPESEQSVCSKVDAKFQLSLSATLNTSNATAAGEVSGDATSSGFKQILNLGWRKC